jgi:hypothetical protein
MSWKAYYSVAYWATYWLLTVGAPTAFAVIPLKAFHAERHALVVEATSNVAEAGNKNAS